MQGRRHRCLLWCSTLFATVVLFLGHGREIYKTARSLWDVVPLSRYNLAPSQPRVSSGAGYLLNIGWITKPMLSAIGIILKCGSNSRCSIRQESGG
ncbi:hypothetical protein F4824DRAFT_421898 [Ustulina deusta]|nr:hypothetical protein F4824DRAFT_421898 [Ustulina deusta]